MASVFLLQQSKQIKLEELKTIGVYSSKSKAETAFEKYNKKIVDELYIGCFFIDEYEIDNDNFEDK